MNHCSLFIDPKSPVRGTSTALDLASIASSAFIPFSHWSESFCSTGQRLLIDAQHQLMHLAQLHVDGTVVLHPGALLALVEASPHWAIEYIPQLSSEDKSRSLKVLVQLLDSPDCAMPQFQHSIGLALALASMAINPYPGGEHPHPADEGSRKQRALQAYFHHAIRGSETTMTLIAFGLLGLLDRSNDCVFDISTIELVVQTFAQIRSSNPLFHPIHSLPTTFTMDHYATHIVVQHLKRAEEGAREHKAYNEAAAALCTEYLVSGLGTRSNDGQLYALAVSGFCNAQSDDLRTACSRLLNNLEVPDASSLVKYFTNANLFSALLKISLARNTPLAPTAMRHLWSITNNLVEAQQPGALSLLEKMFEDQALVSRRNLVSGGLPSPPNLDDIGFTDIWLPLLEEMRDDESVRPAVIQSGVIRTMINFYETSTQMQSVDPQKRTAALERLMKLRQLYNSKHSHAREAEGC